MKTKLFITTIFVFALLLCGSYSFAATETLDQPSETIGSTITATVPLSKSVEGTYTGAGSGVGYSAGLYHKSGSREYGTWEEATSIYWMACSDDPCTTSQTPTAGAAGDYNTMTGWTAQ